MRMHVDESGGDDQAAGIDRSRRVAVDLSDGFDAIVFDGDVAVKPRIPGTVDDFAVTNNEIVMFRGAARAGDQCEETPKEVWFHGLGFPRVRGNSSFGKNRMASSR